MATKDKERQPHPADDDTVVSPEDAMNAEGAEIHGAGAIADGDPAETVQSPADRIHDLEEQLLRARADYQNLQRRVHSETTDRIRYANSDLMRSLLDVLDDLERAIGAADQAGQNAPMLEGVRLIHAKLEKTLSDFGLTTIAAEGQPFDPQVHEALMQQPSNEHPPGTVLQELARGYKLHDRVLRPTKAIISKAAE